MRHFIEGFWSAFQLAPQYDSSNFEQEINSIINVSDADKLRQDWQQTGLDINNAIRKFDSGYHQSQKK